MKNAKLLVSAFLLLTILNSTLAFQVPFKTIVGSDVYQPAEPGRVKMAGFLGNRMDISRNIRLKKHITEEMLLAGFRNRPGSHPWIGEHVGKWLHAATLALENKPDDNALRQKRKSIAEALMACQAEDGYLGTYTLENRWAKYDRSRPRQFWGGWDVWTHKYDMIGLLNYYRSTGDPNALQCCENIAALMINTFKGNKRDILASETHCGMADTSILEPMTTLYQLTGNERYLAWCRYLIQRADSGPGIITDLEKYRTVQKVGNKKAYEMMSNYVGLVEHWRSTGYERGLNAAALAWESIYSENLFITGAPDAHERWSPPHTLITTGNCTETCVQVTWMQLCWQLFRATGNAKYAQTIHTLLYNHLTAAQHPEGTDWCYFTTMEGKKRFTSRMHCCSSSGPRAIAMIPTFAYMTAKDSVAINLYETSRFKTTIKGVDVTIRQKTNYPFDGDIAIEVETASPVEFDLRLLIPNFVRTGQLTVKDEKSTNLLTGKYQTVRRLWKDTTKINLQFDMPVVSHERNGRYALSRGPVIMAADNIDPDTLNSCEIRPDLSAINKKFSKQVTKEFKKAAKKAAPFSPPAIKVKGLKTDSESKKSEKIYLTYRPYSQAGASKEFISIYLPLLPQPEKK